MGAMAAQLSNPEPGSSDEARFQALERRLTGKLPSPRVITFDNVKVS